MRCGAAVRKTAAGSRKPNSVRLRSPLRRASAGDDHSSSPAIAGGIKRPTRKPRTGRPMTCRRLPHPAVDASLFGLAPCGVLPATRVTTGAVRSYRTFSPLPASARRPCGAGVRRASPRLEVAQRSCGPARRSRARRRAVYFLCHFPSGCPDRALPGALPCGVRTFLPCLRPCGLRRGSDRLAHCDASALKRTASGDRLASCDGSPLSVGFLRDLVLLELLVQIAARRVDHLGGLRDVPAVLAQLADQERALGVLLELAQRARPSPARRRRAGLAAAAPARRRARRRGRSATSIVSPAVMMISRSTVLRSSRMLPFQR